MPFWHPAGQNIRKLAGAFVSAACVWVLCAVLISPVSAQSTGAADEFATLVADSLYLDGPDRLIAQGNVEALMRRTRLQARRVIYDRSTGRLTIEGPIVLTEGDEVVILADQAELSEGMTQGLIRSARVVYDQQLQIAAHSINRVDARFTEMNAVIASSCEICATRPTPLWEIRARRVVHDDAAKQIYFENAQFRLLGVPVVYIPRLRIPDPRLDRATGFLSPRFVFDTKHGLGLRAPYFIVLSQDRDLLLTPFVGTKGTRALEFRYRQAFASGMLELGGLVARDSIRPGDTRVAASMAGEFAVGRGYQLRFNLIQPSDRQVLEDYGQTDARLTNEITLERVRRDQRVRVQALQFRSLRLGEVNAALPNRVGQAVLEQRMDMPAIGGVGAFRLEAHLHQRERSVLPFDPADPRPRDVSRLSLDLEWRRDAVLPLGVLGGVGVQLGLDQFQISGDVGLPRSPSRITPNVMAELRWPLLRHGADGVTYVIEPVAQIIWGRNGTGNFPNDTSRLPELDEGNLFSFDRFAGRDIRESGTRANLGISLTRHDPEGWSSRFTLGRIWRARDLGQFSPDTPLGGAQSDWLVAASIGTVYGLEFATRSHFTSDFNLQRTALELDWTGEQHSLSTSYMRIKRNPFEGRARSASEWSFEGAREIDEMWTARIGWRYDIAQKRAARANFGLDYENECLRMSLGLEREFASATTPAPRTAFGLNIDILGIGGNPSRARRACTEM